MSLHNKIPDQINQGSVVHIHIINYIYVFLLLQISFYVLRLAFHNAPVYESLAGYPLLRNFV